MGESLMGNAQFDGTLAKKLNSFISLTPEELTWLARMQSEPLTVKRGKQLTHEGQTGHKAFVLQALLRTADHSFSALTDAVVTPVEGAHILKCVTEFPRLGAALLWAASRDEAMVVEHLVNIGRRSAIERTKELAERLSLVGLATMAEFKCPLSQFVLADALGLTAIHVNRVLRQLRELGLLTLHKGRVKIHDLNGLRKLAGFQGGYLNSRD
jgi:biotin operon repressor